MNDYASDYTSDDMTATNTIVESHEEKIEKIVKQGKEASLDEYIVDSSATNEIEAFQYDLIRPKKIIIKAKINNG